MDIDVYAVGIVIVMVVIMLATMTHGFHKGFAREISGFVSLIAAMFVILLIAGVTQGFRTANASNLAVGLILFVVFGAIYKIIHLFVTSMNFIAGLPVISWLDSALGLVVGLLEGFAILYILEYFMRNYLLA